MFPAEIRHERRATAIPNVRTQNSDNDFVKLIAVDLSPLELRFANVFSRLAAIETHLKLKQQQQADHEEENSQHPIADEDEAGDGEIFVEEVDKDDVPLDDVKVEPKTEDISAETAVSRPKIYMDGAILAQEMESLRAAQLRLQIEQEVAHSMLQLQLTQLRTNLEQKLTTELQEFQDQMTAASNVSSKSLENTYQKLAQSMNGTLAERQVAENRWKATFESTIAARIQDVWSGLHSTSRKLQENMQYLQTELVTQEENAREMTSFVESIKTWNTRLDRDSNKHGKRLAEQEKEMEHVHSMCVQASMRLDEQDGKLMSHVGLIYQQIESAGASVQQHIQAYDTFVTRTDQTLTAIASDLAACSSTLTAHETSLNTLDIVGKRQNEQLIQINERMGTTDAIINSVTGRVALTEKKLTNLTGRLEEHYHEQQQSVAGIQRSLNQASLERTAMKQHVSDLGFVVQEVQHKLHEVSKSVDTTELALSRTAAELPKMHALVTTNASNIAKNRQRLRDVTLMIEDDRKTVKTLRSQFDQEVVDSLARATAATDRDAQTQDRITHAAVAVGHVTAELEARLVQNGNLLHQLNTMVDSLAVTETTEDMEDKMSSFALACAQLGLKLEFFGRTASSVAGACVMKDDVKASLAILLTKVIRFLGSGVAIDQNKYLLTAKRTQAVDPMTGQRTMESPSQHVLESFRLAKAAAFTVKTRTAMDQLAPVLETNRSSMDFRDAFERKLRFVLEFGLANLFPNLGKPKNPSNRRGGEFGTCIACDRPIDSDDPQHDEGESDGPIRHRAQMSIAAQAEETAPEQQRSTSPTSRPSSAAVRNRIDTKTAVRGRSGASTIRPKSGSDVVHYTPGSGEFVYRGGFRIPKNGAGRSSSSISSDKIESNGPVDVDNSCLEKVALVGRHQDVESSSSISVGGGAAAVRAARPHTAPLRMKSLPRLDTTSRPGQLVLDTAEQQVQQLSS